VADKWFWMELNGDEQFSSENQSADTNLDVLLSYLRVGHLIKVKGVLTMLLVFIY